MFFPTPTVKTGSDYPIPFCIPYTKSSHLKHSENLVSILLRRSDSRVPTEYTIYVVRAKRWKGISEFLFLKYFNCVCVFHGNIWGLQVTTIFRQSWVPQQQNIAHFIRFRRVAFGRSPSDFYVLSLDIPCYHLIINSTSLPIFLQMQYSIHTNIWCMHHIYKYLMIIYI